MDVFLILSRFYSVNFKPKLLFANVIYKSVIPNEKKSTSDSIEISITITDHLFCILKKLKQKIIFLLQDCTIIVIDNVFCFNRKK